MLTYDVFFILFAVIFGLICLSYVCYSCYKCFFSINDAYISSYAEIVYGGHSWTERLRSYHIGRSLDNNRHWGCRPAKMPLVNESGFPIRPHQYPGSRSETRSNDSYGTMECSSSTTRHWYDSISSSGAYSTSSGVYSQSTTCPADVSSNSISTVASIHYTDGDNTYFQQGATTPQLEVKNRTALIEAESKYRSIELSTNEK
ncbi:uncharacterized protein [Palaemon carinicauda]|uniref:uncharacterized protein isoform X2 n=1 Tax=Palaemon carinicauda TaxID=392227 RepID=UPI0035B681F1